VPIDAVNKYQLRYTSRYLDDAIEARIDDCLIIRNMSIDEADDR